MAAAQPSILPQLLQWLRVLHRRLWQASRLSYAAVVLLAGSAVAHVVWRLRQRLLAPAPPPRPSVSSESESESAARAQARAEALLDAAQDRAYVERVGTERWRALRDALRLCVRDEAALAHHSQGGAALVYSSMRSLGVSQESLVGDDGHRQGADARLLEKEGDNAEGEGEENPNSCDDDGGGGFPLPAQRLLELVMEAAPFGEYRAGVLVAAVVSCVALRVQLEQHMRQADAVAARRESPLSGGGARGGNDDVDDDGQTDSGDAYAHTEEGGGGGGGGGGGVDPARLPGGGVDNTVDSTSGVDDISASSTSEAAVAFPESFACLSEAQDELTTFLEELEQLEAVLGIRAALWLRPARKFVDEAAAELRGRLGKFRWTVLRQFGGILWRQKVCVRACASSARTLVVVNVLVCSRLGWAAERMCPVRDVQPTTPPWRPSLLLDLPRASAPTHVRHALLLLLLLSSRHRRCNWGSCLAARRWP